MKRKCKCGCGANIDHKHINAKFLNQKHKDRYHNKNNPRGYSLRQRDSDDYDEMSFSDDKELFGNDGCNV